MASQTVAGELYESITGQLFEIGRQLRQKSGYPFDSQKLKFVLQNAIEGRFDPRVRLDQLFLSPHIQLEQFRLWNEHYKLGFTADELKSVLEIPRDQGAGLIRPLLEICLETPEKSFETIWQIVKDRQAADGFGHWRWEELRSDPKHLRLRQGIEWRRGLRWIMLDLGANHKLSSDQVRQDSDTKTLAHIAVLCAGAFFPNWVRNMGQEVDNTFIPFVDIAGFEVWISGADPWAGVPYLRWDAGDRQVGLDTSWSGVADVSWCVPVLRECPFAMAN